MQKVISLKNGRLYCLSENKLSTCDEQSPTLTETLDYGICERLGLICEECRLPVFFAQEGVRAGGDDNLEPIIVAAHFRHYAVKAAQFCSQRVQSAEGRKAYRQVLHPIARGQWLSRFKSCFLHAITAEYTDKHTDPPIFCELLSLGARLKNANMDDDQFLSALTSGVLAEREHIHSLIDSVIVFLDISGQDETPRWRNIYHLVQSFPGGIIAQGHCAHLAFDFILAEPQKDILKTLVVHCLAHLDMMSKGALDDFIALRMNRVVPNNIFRLSTTATEGDAVQLFDKLLEDIFTIISLLISRVPWQYVWPYAVEEARRKPILDISSHQKRKRKTSTRGMGFKR